MGRDRKASAGIRKDVGMSGRKRKCRGDPVDVLKHQGAGQMNRKGALTTGFSLLTLNFPCVSGNLVTSTSISSSGREVTGALSNRVKGHQVFNH